MKALEISRIWGVLLCSLWLFFSCQEKKLEPIHADGGKPEDVTITGVEPVAGGVLISYRIPASGDVLEIKAVYTLTNGEKREVVGSIYTNNLLLEGYNDTQEHEAMVYAVNRAQTSSDGMSVKFTPLESPISKTIRSLQIVADFGGANFSWKNEDQASLTFELLTTNEFGKLRAIRILTSRTDSVGISLRGYEMVPQKFGVIVSDNFHNVSDTIFPAGGTLTPLFEQKLDKDLMQVRILDGDCIYDLWEGRAGQIIDDDINTIGHTDYNTLVLGAPFTLDLGRKTKLSRFLIHQRYDGNRYYQTTNPKLFEVWGIDELGDSPSGDWSRWKKIMTCEIIKPSGAPFGTQTQEDLIAAQNGHEFSFSPNLEPLRYIRFKFLEVWNPDRTFFHLAEITPYGKYEE